MAEIFDPFKAAPEAPSIADPFAPGYKPPETGFVPTMKRTAGQMLTGLATAAEDAGLGANAITQGLRNYGQGVIDRNPAGINSLSDVVAHPWETVKESLGQVAPQMATGILGRMAGGALGGAIAGPPGAAIGGLLGAVAPIFTQEYGGIRDDQKQSGTEDKGKALAAAAGATAIDFLGGPESRLIRKGVTPLAEKAGSSALKDYATAIGKGVATEGAQEGVQNVIEQLGASRNPTEAGSLEDTALASIMGGIGGGVAGAGEHLLRSAKPAAVESDSTAAPAQPAVDPTTGPIGRAAATAQATGAAQEQQRIASLRAAADQAMAGTNAPAGTATDTTSEKASAQQSPSGSFGNLAEFESLLNQERGDLAGRRQALADAQQQDREARLAEIGNAVDYARTAESERQRNAVMDQVFSAPETAYASPQQLTQAFSGALAQAGFRDTAPTEREQARMARALDARSAILQSERQAPAAGSFGNLADFESLLNSEQADLGNRRMALQRQQANAPTGLTPEKQTRLADELAAGWKPFGKRGLVSPSGKKHLLSIPELDYLRSLKERSNGAIPGQTPTGVAAQGDQARGAEPGGSAGDVAPQPAVERGAGAGAGTAAPGVQPDVAVRDVAGGGGVDATQARGSRPAGVEAATPVGNEAPGRAQVAQGTAPVQIPAVQNAPTFDFSGKSPDQIAWLSGHGINGWKEAAQAEIARRNQSEQNLGMVPTAPQPTNPAPVQAAPTAEGAIRAAWQSKEGVTLGSWHPLTVEHNGVRRDFLANQKKLSNGKSDAAVHLVSIRNGRLLSSDPVDRKSTRLNSSHHSISY